MFTHTKSYSVAHPNLMKLISASRAHSAHLEILQLLFLSSVASTAPRCDSSSLRQSILPESYIWGEYTHKQYQDFDQREPYIPALTATHTYIVHSESPHTINNYMVHVHVHLVLMLTFSHVALWAVCSLGICSIQAVRVKTWIKLTVR